MALTPGTRVGVYEVTAQIGEGGMGQVYRARDTKLNRDVALKVLPDAFANDPERMARFTREAQTLAALNHPNIAHIHGLEESGEVRALVMELVEGEDLSQRIAHGAIAIDEAQLIAIQVAEALEAAHEQEIIHRDLKPANIKVRHDGTVKVLDFGLARAMEPAGVAENVSQSPTITTPAMTQAGMILGTAAYMSPEQAKGRLLDKRSDVWAFGCVFYEMLTAKRAFDGEDVTDTIAAVVRGEPDWSALPADVPQQIRLLLRRCLEKDRRARVSDIGVARFLMKETVAADAPLTPATPQQPHPRSRRRLITGASLGLVAALGIVALAVMAGTRLAPRTVLQSARFVIVPPAAQPLSIQGTSRDIAISPDGSHIVYRVGVGAQQQLVVRALNELDAKPLAGITTIVEPFMSPDGRWIGFFAGDELRKVAITGGPPSKICRISAAPRGASWGPDDVIFFSVADQRTGLLSVSANGGEPKVLTLMDANNAETGHIFPFVLPGGRAVLFTISSGLATEAQVAVLDLDTGQRKTLVRGGRDAAYIPASTNSGQPGYLVYANGGTLRALRFDLPRLEVVGDPVPVVDQVMTGAIGQADFALSQQGTLVYIPGGVAAPSAEPRSLVWVNRQGREEPTNAPPRAYAVARLSPNGTRVALDIRDQNSSVWTWDLGRQTLTPVNVTTGTNMSPVWTPDGQRIIWASSRDGGNPNLYWQAADGTGVPVRLTTSPAAQFPTSMSASQLVFFGPHPTGMMGAATPLDLGVVTVEGSSMPRTKPLIESTAAKSNPEISPDGHWIAYQSNESGQVQVFVRPFPNVNGGRTLISPGGGTRPAWARNGRELFYLDSDGLLTSVPVRTTASTFSAGNPTTILKTRYYAGSTTRNFDLRAYDVSQDGQRFLMIKEAVPADPKSIAPSASLVVVLNWLEELKALMPTK